MLRGCRFVVEVLPGSPDTLTNEFTLSGGGAPTVTVKDSVGVIDTEPFHVGRFEARTTYALRSPDSAHRKYQGYEGPAQNQTISPCSRRGRPPPGDNHEQVLLRRSTPATSRSRTAVVRLPPGFFGNPAAAPRCPIQTILAVPKFEFPVEDESPPCPPGSKIGKVGLSILEFYDFVQVRPLYNVTPDRGYSAQFAANVYGNTFSLYVVPLPRYEGYGLTIGSTNSARAGVKMFSAFFYGVPSEHGSGTSGAPLPDQPRRLLGSRTEMGSLSPTVGRTRADWIP